MKVKGRDAWKSMNIEEVNNVRGQRQRRKEKCGNARTGEEEDVKQHRRINGKRDKGTRNKEKDRKEGKEKQGGMKETGNTRTGKNRQRKET